MVLHAVVRKIAEAHLHSRAVMFFLVGRVQAGVTSSEAKPRCRPAVERVRVSAHKWVIKTLTPALFGY